MANKKILLLSLVFSLLALVGNEMTYKANNISIFENFYYNLWHQFAGKRRDANNTAVVVIDNQTLASYKNKPLLFWGNEFAHAIDALKQVGVLHIGIDFVFTINPEKLIQELGLSKQLSRSFDSAMRRQLNSGAVSLAGLKTCYVSGKCENVLPRSDYLAMLPGKLNDIGIINMQDDSDGIIRQYYTHFPGDSSAPSLNFPTLLTIRALGFTDNSLPWESGPNSIYTPGIPQRIAFTGPPGNVMQISFNTLLTPGAASDPVVQQLRNRIIIIAADYSGNLDVHPTPYSNLFNSRKSGMMIGGEIHANTIETLLAGNPPKDAPLWLRCFLIFILMSFASWAFLTLRPLQAFFLSGAFAISHALFSYSLFLWYNTVFPVAGFQASLMIVYLACIGLRLTGEEKERKRIRQIFGRYVSNEVVDELIALKGLPNLGGEIHEVTILFADIRNFTTLSEKLQPSEVVELLNQYFSEICEVIMAEKGTVDKFIGDAVMALFGAPIKMTDHAERAVCTAIAMLEVSNKMVSWMAKRFPDRQLPVFKIGIGLHTGAALIGNIGSDQRTEYTAIGDTVNIASRLEGLTKSQGWSIIASQETVSALSDKVILGNTTTTKVKGKQQSVIIHEILEYKEN